MIFNKCIKKDVQLNQDTGSTFIEVFPTYEVSVIIKIKI